MDFSLLNKSISFSDKQLACANILKIFGEYADIAEETTSIVYLNKIKSYKDLLADNGSIIQIVVNTFFEPTMNFIVSNGIYDYSDKDLLAEFNKKNTISKDMEELLKPFDSIIQENGAMQEYRELRKESRDRVVGGGFGLEGAVKGMATAGALNFAAGIGHSIMNCIGNAIDNAAADNEMSKLFQDEELIKKYATIAMSNVLTIKNIVIDLFKRKELIVTSWGQSNDSSLFENLKKGRIPQPEASNIYLTLITNAPHTLKYYNWGIEAYPEYKDTLIKMKHTMCYEFQYLSDSIEKEDDLTKFDKLVFEKAQYLTGINYIAKLTAQKTETETQLNSEPIVLKTEEKDEPEKKNMSINMCTLCKFIWAGLICEAIVYGTYNPYDYSGPSFIHILSVFAAFILAILSAIIAIDLTNGYRKYDKENIVKKFEKKDIIISIFTLLPAGIQLVLTQKTDSNITSYVLIGAIILTILAVIFGLRQQKKVQ